MTNRVTAAFLAVVLASLIVVVSCRAQMVKPPEPEPVKPYSRLDESVSYDYLQHVYGFTYCVAGKGHSFVSTDLSGIDRLSTVAHELKHQEQNARFPTCEDYDAYLGTFKGKLLIEAEAYATGLCKGVSLGGNRLSIRRDAADKIYTWVVKGQMSATAISDIIRHFEDLECPEKK